MLTYVYSLSIYPLIPNYLGGGRPIVRSVLADEVEIDFLNKNFGIGNPKSKVQTGNMCLLYENKNVEIYTFLNEGRVIIFNKLVSKFRGSNYVIYNQKEKLDELSGMCHNFFNGNIFGINKMQIGQ